MKLFEYIDRVNLLNKLISEKKTGTPNELAKRLHLSKSRLCRVIEDLKLKGEPIAYSRNVNTYHYTKRYKMRIDFEFKLLDDEDIKSINGGFLAFKSNLFNAFFVH